MYSCCSSYSLTRRDHALLAHRQVLRVWRRIVFEASEREIERASSDPVQEIPIVGHDQAGAVPTSQERLEPLQHLEVEVVGRLIEQQQVRVGEQGLGQRDTSFLATAEAVDRLVEHVFGESETEQHFIGAMLDVVPMGRIESRLQLVVFDQEVVEPITGIGHAMLDLAHSVGNLKHVREGRTSFLPQGIVLVKLDSWAR